MPVPAVVAGAPFAATSKLIVGDTKLTPLASLSLRHSNSLLRLFCNPYWQVNQLATCLIIVTINSG